MTNKKITLVRILLYLVFAFGLSFGLQVWYFTQYGWAVSGQGFPVLVSFCMLCPALANGLTRLITRQGGKDLLIDFRLRGVRLSYAAAILLPPLCAIAVFFCAALCCLPAGSLGDIFQSLAWGKAGGTMLYAVCLAAAGCLFGFGEEFGWRGYLTPQLEKLLPLPAVLPVTGIVWGCWHGLLIAAGAYYTREDGKDFWLALGLMCLYGIGLSVFATAVTKSTGSVIAASLFRAGLEKTVLPVSALLLSYARAAALAELKASSYDLAVLLVSTALCLTVGMVLMLCYSRKHRRSAAERILNSE